MWPLAPWALQWRSDLARDPASPPASPHEGFARGYLFAALWETFKVVYPIARLAPVQVTLSLQLTGQIAGTDPADPLRPGVETCLALGPAAASAQSSSLTATTMVMPVMTHRDPREDRSRPTCLTLFDKPAAAELQAIDDQVQTSNGGTAVQYAVGPHS